MTPREQKESFAEAVLAAAERAAMKWARDNDLQIQFLKGGVLWSQFLTRPYGLVGDSHVYDVGVSEKGWK